MLPAFFVYKGGEINMRTSVIVQNMQYSKSEFAEFLKFKLSDSEDVKFLKTCLNKVIEADNEGDITAVYKEIEKFHEYFLENKPVSLLTIANLDSPDGNYRWSWVVKEADVLSDKTGMLKYNAGVLTDNIKKYIIEEEISKVLSKHLFEMINFVEKKTITWEEFTKLDQKYDIITTERLKKYINKEEKKENKLIHWKYQFLRDNALIREKDIFSYKIAIYGVNDTYKQQIADAYLQHLGSKHSSLFVGPDLATKLSSFSQRTVAQEEKANLTRLLVESKNNTPWQTGGDLILFNKKEEVIANIQLKAMTKEKDTYVGGQITTDDLIKKYVSQLKELIEKGIDENIKKIIDKMFKMLSTSGIQTDISEKIEKVAFEETKKAAACIDKL